MPGHRNSAYIGRTSYHLASHPDRRPATLPLCLHVPLSPLSPLSLLFLCPLSLCPSVPLSLCPSFPSVPLSPLSLCPLSLCPFVPLSLCPFVPLSPLSLCPSVPLSLCPLLSLFFSCIRRRAAYAAIAPSPRTQPPASELPACAPAFPPP
jgi:hypothetical protein